MDINIATEFRSIKHFMEKCKNLKSCENSVLIEGLIMGMQFPELLLLKAFEVASWNSGFLICNNNNDRISAFVSYMKNEYPLANGYYKGSFYKDLERPAQRTLEELLIETKELNCYDSESVKYIENFYSTK